MTTNPQAKKDDGSVSLLQGLVSLLKDDRALAKALREAKKAGNEFVYTESVAGRGTGSLRLRARSGELPAAYFRYVTSKGKQDDYPLGICDPEGRGGHTFKYLRNRVGALSRLYQSGVRNIRDHLEHEQAVERAKIEEAKRARAHDERMARSGTLQALIDGYCGYLDNKGKQSARDVRNILRFNVTEAAPEFAAMKASAITSKDVSAILAKCVERGAGRTAGKVRSYLSAAFALALAAEHDPTVAASLHGFEVVSNPAASVPAKGLAQFNRVRDRVLNAAELKGYMAALDKLPDSMAKAALWAGLLLGGQRSRQLLRLRPVDVDLDAATVCLYDGKGNRQQPRPHVLPLTEGARERIEWALGKREKTAYVFSSYGKVPLRVETLTMEVAEISKALVASGVAREPFELRDVRRTAETQMAAMGVSSDVRAQILSHALGGVANRHYQRHDFMQEKLAALQSWERRLAEIKTSVTANVVPIAGKRGGKRTS